VATRRKATRSPEGPRGQIMLRLTRSDHERIRADAAREGVSMSLDVERLVRRALHDLEVAS